jgi:formylglycine-generating enzyme required for sulfatase activity
MSRKKKRRQKRDYEEYKEYDEEDSLYDEEEDEEEEIEEIEDSEVILSPVRSVGKRKKNSKSSFVRVQARPVTRRLFYAPPHPYVHEKHGPHFTIQRPPENFSSRRPPGNSNGSVFSAFGKLFVLIFVLAAGTWLAFSLSGDIRPHSRHENETVPAAPEVSGTSTPKKSEFHKTDMKQAPGVLSLQPAKNKITQSRPAEDQEISPDNSLQEQSPFHGFHQTSARMEFSADDPQVLLEELNRISPMRMLPGGKFQMGNAHGRQSDQRPAHQVTLSPFRMDQTPVTNRQFQLFVTATGYQTAAEKQGWSYVFDFDKKDWVKKEKAYWKAPLGENSWSDDLWDHPVTHVSWEDALAFCRWCGKKLPTEAQWEYAARGGLLDQTYPWGNTLLPKGKCAANYWQGWFPDQNTAADGYLRTSPVQAFPPNPFGLYDMAGNVWEWCSDFYSENYYSFSAVHDPAGPPRGEYHSVRGGSFLSAENRDAGYSVAARSFQTPEAGYQDIGFRCVADAK